MAIELAARIDHPAYDCLYLSLALKEKLQIVTADDSLVRKLQQFPDPKIKSLALPLQDFA